MSICYDDPSDDEPVEINLKGVRLKRLRNFGDVWLTLGLWRLLGLEYELLLYDVTSTYFEGECKGNPMAKRGYSRDSRHGKTNKTVRLRCVTIPDEAHRKCY